MAADGLCTVQINEHIASYLTNDKDLCRFTAVCTQTYVAVHNERAGLWRERFTACYDLPPGKSGSELKQIYQMRRKALYNEIEWVVGQRKEEALALVALRDIVVGMSANFEHFYHSLHLSPGDVVGGFTSDTFVSATAMISTLFRACYTNLG